MDPFPSDPGSTSERTCPRQSLAGSNRASAHPTTHAGLSALVDAHFLLSPELPCSLSHPKGLVQGSDRSLHRHQQALGARRSILGIVAIEATCDKHDNERKILGSGFVSGLESARAAHLRSRRSPLRLPARTRSRPISRLASPPRQQALVRPLPIASRRIGPCSAASRVRFATPGALDAALRADLRAARGRWATVRAGALGSGAGCGRAGSGRIRGFGRRQRPRVEAGGPPLAIRVQPGPWLARRPRFRSGRRRGMLGT